MENPNNRPDAVQPVDSNPYNQPPKNAGLKAFIPTALISVAVCLAILLTGFFPTAYAKQIDLETNIKNVLAEIGTAKTNASDAITRANTANQNTFATKGSVDSLQKTVDGLKSPDLSAITLQVSTATSRVDSLSKQVSDDQATIKNLQTQLYNLQLQVNTLNSTATTTATTNAITASFATSSWIPTSYTPSATTPTFQMPFKLTIKNGLNKPVTNLQLFVSMYASTSGGTGVSLQSLSGGTWTVYTSATNVYYFTNVNGMSAWGGSGLTVPANGSTTITLIFNYTAPATAYGTLVTFSPDIAPISTNDYTVG